MNKSIDYSIQGRGRPVLLIHGWAMQADVWNPVANDLSSRYQVIKVDLRGHGRSKDLEGPFNYDIFAQDIIQLINKLSLKNLTLVGWSMGASVILKMLKQYAPEFHSLVFISGNPSLVKREDYEHGLPEIVVKRLYRNTERDLNRGLKTFIQLLFTDTERSALTQNTIYRTITDIKNAPKKEAALESLKCLQDEDLRPVLKKINSPVLLIHGKKDQISLAAAAVFMNDQINRSDLLLLEETGHVPFLSREKEVLKKLHAFLENA